MRRNFKIAIGSIVAVYIGYVLFAHPDTDFRSSDAKWVDSEVGFKGRRLDSIVVYFEDYRISCAVPDVILLRTTSRNWFNVFAWHNYLTDRKWRVPYAAPIIGIDDDYSRLDKNCSNNGWTDADYKAAKEAAQRYLEKL